MCARAVGDMAGFCTEIFLNGFAQWCAAMKTLGGDKGIIVQLVMGNKAFSCPTVAEANISRIL